MFSQSGDFTGYVGSCTEVHLQKTITQQLNYHVDERTRQLKEANEELENANSELVQTADRLQSVLNGVPASVTLMQPVRDDSGLIIDFTTSAFNQKALELTGQSAGEISKNTLLESHPEFRDSELFGLYVKVMTEGEPAYKEVSGLRTDQNETLAFLITRQIDGKGIVVTVLDISRRKQAEIKLTQTAESLQAVLDSSPASIGFFKALYNEGSDAAFDFKLIVCNQKFGSAFENPSAQLIGSLASELYTPQRLQQMIEVLESSIPYYEEHQHADDKWQGISLTQHDHGVAITELDISSLKSAQQQQDELIDQLDGSFKMIQSLAVMKEYVQHRGSFLRSTFHDLRGSFGIIVGAATLLNMLDTEEERAKVLDMIQRNLEQVTLMMNQLLDYSRLESGEEKLETAPFDAATLLTELSIGSETMAKDKNLWIRYTGPQTLPVEGDFVKVRRIAQNLILNAVKYTKEGGVTISWESIDTNEKDSAPLWKFIIKDTGPGIPQKLIAQLSSRGSTSAQNGLTDENIKKNELNNSQGEGIGLFIVKRLCELLGAEMHITSDAASGTVFSIILPKSYQKVF